LNLFPVDATVAPMGEAEAIAAAPASPRKPSGMFSYFLVITVFLVVIYVLGMGPAVKYHRAFPGTAAANVLESIYAPFEQLCMTYPPAYKLLKGYMSLWVGDK
jgi:hypothetical protein